MGKSKGMTLVELLIAMGLSVIIMAATFVVVQYSSDTYESTIERITYQRLFLKIRTNTIIPGVM